MLWMILGILYLSAALVFYLSITHPRYTGGKGVTDYRVAATLSLLWPFVFIFGFIAGGK